MAQAKDTPPPTFLRRWSQRKLAAARETPEPPLPVPPVAPDVAQGSAAVAPGASPASPAPAESAAPPALPDVESLTFESDFRPFLAPKVDEGARRAALRKLFSDPRFNVMDGLDVYIDDYTKFEPVTPDVLAQLNHARYLFDPPKTRVNEHGHVEDVPESPPTPAPEDADAASGSGTAVVEDVASPAALSAVADAAPPVDPDAGPPAPPADPPGAALPPAPAELPRSAPESPQ